jgi:lipoprotein-releasing system permease protein
MSSRFEIWVGNRYVRSRSRNSFVSLISAISMLGIAIAVLVLIVVMSVVNGFERELKDRLLSMTAHASIEDVNGELMEYAVLRDTALKNPRVQEAAPYVDGQALLVSGSQLSGAELRGVEPELENSVSGVGDVMQSGRLDELVAGTFNIVLGVELADALQVDVGDKVTVTLAQGMVTPAGVIRRHVRVRPETCIHQHW